MRYFGHNKGWRELATACLRNAVKTSDIDCIRYDIFSVLCGLAEKDENDVIVELRHANDMKKLYGDKWYRRGLK